LLYQQQTAVKLSFDGQLLQQQAKLFNIDSDLAASMWQINNLDFKAKTSSKRLF
jgi:hypothetical protein